MRLLDDTPAGRALHKTRCEAHDRYRRVANSNSDRTRRTELLNIRGEMTEPQKKEFATLLADRVGDKAATDPVKAINGMSGEWEFKRVAELAVKVRYGLGQEPEDY